MSYLVDSDLVADYLKGRRGSVEFLGPLAGDGLAISIITFAEVYEGILYGRDRPAHERVFTQFLRGVDVLSVNRKIAKRYAKLAGELRSSGQMLDQRDLFIASTALCHDLMLLTRNLRHFQRISGLRIQSPTSPI
jgi:tRNA(fMet)-specific endonuclease VapC